MISKALKSKILIITVLSAVIIAGLLNIQQAMAFVFGSEGDVSFWGRAGTTISPKTAGDNITTTGTGTFGILKIPQIGGTAGKFSIFQGGANTADLTYTLPTAYPASIAFLKISDAGVMTTDTAIYLTSVTAHNLLSATHGDTTASTVARGDLVVGTGASATWDNLALGTVGKILRSDGTDLKYTTATFADTYGASTLLYANGANTVEGLATGNSGVLITSGTGVPSIATDIPTAVTIGTKYIYRADGTDVPVADGGTGVSTLTTAYGLLAAGTTATGTVQTLANGTIHQILTSGGAALPTWGTVTENAGALAAITTIGMSGQLTSTLAIGTSPFAVTSTTVNTNLNADLLDGQHASAFLTSVTAHNLLSATHGDTTASSVARGDLIVGTGVSPTWDNLTLGTVGKILRSDGTDLKYTTATFADTGTAYRLPVFSATNVMTELAAVGATGEYLAGATGAIPAWATLNQAAVAGLTTADGPTFAHLHLSDLAAITTAAESWVGPSSTAGIYFKGGNVGIGTTVPVSELHINTGAIGGLTLGVDDSVSGATAVMYRDETSGNLKWESGYLSDSNAIPNSWYIYQYRDSVEGVVNQYRLVINNSGKVGIGTTAPGELLSLGLAGTTKGVLSLSGNTSGKIIIQPAAEAGTYTLTLPIDDGTTSQFLQTDGSGVLTWATALTSVTAHNLLSTTHGDTTAASVARGDILIGSGVTPKWVNLAKGSAGAFVRTDGTDVMWSTLILPNAGTAYKLAAYTATNTLTELAAVGATGTLLRGNTGAIPTWSTVTETSGALAAITTISMSGQLTSTLATGTAPFVVASTTQVANLNVSQLQGYATGTSGAAIPLLNGTNTWSGTNAFSNAVTFNSGQTITPATDATALTLTGTNVLTNNLALFSAGNTQGTIFKIGWVASPAQQNGTVKGQEIDLNTSANPSGSYSVTGLQIALPNQTAAANIAYNGITINPSGTTFNTAADSGTSTWSGIALTMPAVTQGSGSTLTSIGLNIAAGTKTSGTNYAIVTTAAAGNVVLGANLQLPNAGSIYPATDTATALYINKADNATHVMTVDTSGGNVIFSGDITVSGGDITGANSQALDLGEATSTASTFSGDLAVTGGDIFGATTMRIYPATTLTGSYVEVAAVDGGASNTHFNYGATDDIYLSYGTSGSVYMRAAGTTRLTLASTGNLTMTGNLLLPASGTIGIAADPSLLTLATDLLTVGGAITSAGTITSGLGSYSDTTQFYTGMGYTGSAAAYGVKSYRYQYVNANANAVVGVYGQGGSYDLGANTLAWGIGVQGLGSYAGTGTLTNAASLYAKTPTGGTNRYGLYLEAVTGGTTNYGVYSAGGNNYFGGNVGIGATPTVQLETSQATASTGVWALMLRNRANAADGLYDVGLKLKFSTDGGNETNKWVGIQADPGGWANTIDMVFYVQPNAGNVPVEKFRITSAGDFYGDAGFNFGTSGDTDLLQLAADSITANGAVGITPVSNIVALTLTGTNVTSANLAYFNSKNTSGTIFNIAYGAAATLAGSLVGQSINLNTSVTNAAQSVTGLSLTLPPTTAASTTTAKGITLTSGAFTTAAAATTSTWTGLDVNMPAITQGAGSTLTSTGIKITGGTVTSGTSYAIITDATAGNVGIGTAVPSYPLDVTGNVRLTGGLNVGTTGAGVGQIIASNSVQESNTILGYNLDSTAISTDVMIDDIAIYGRATVSGNITGGVGISADRNVTGGYFYVTDSGILNNNGGTTISAEKTLVGVQGIVISSGTHVSGVSNVYGGSFWATSQSTNVTGTAIGVYASAIGGDTNWAGYFDFGDVYIVNKLGIGNAIPLTALHVGAGSDTPLAGTTLYVSAAGTTNLAIRDSTNNVEMQNYAYSGGGIIGTYTNHSLFIRTNNTDRITIDTAGLTTFAGNVVINNVLYSVAGTSLGLFSYQDVVLDMDEDNNGTNYLYVRNGANTSVVTINESGNITYVAAAAGDSNWVCQNASGQLASCEASSIRYKENLAPLDKGLAEVLQLNPVFFNFKTDINKTRQIGLIAEEVEQIVPELVIYRDGLPENVKYMNLTALLVKAVQELNNQIVKGIAQTKEFIADKITVKTARIEKIEMVDSATGGIYCTWIENGEWQKVKGNCSSTAVAGVIEAITPTVTTPATTTPTETTTTPTTTPIITPTEPITTPIETTTPTIPTMTTPTEPIPEPELTPAPQSETTQQVLDIISVTPISDINVDYGTEIASANLPATVTATLSDDTTQSITVSWDNGMPTYDPNTAGTYVFSGTLTLPENITNTNNLNASVNVLVAEQLKSKKDKDNANDDNIEESLNAVSDLIQDAASGLLNGIWKFARWLFGSGGKAVLSIPIVQKAGTGLMQVPTALQSLPSSPEIKSLAAGLFEPIARWLGLILKP